MFIRSGTICRRNILSLAPNNVMILGGETEKLCMQHAPAVTVARRLRISEKELEAMDW